MGSGSRQYRMMLGESQAIQEHQLAMIPIMQQQAELQLEIQEKAYAQELEQIKQINLLAQQLEPEPIIVPEAKPAPTIDNKYIVLIAIAIGAVLFLRKK